MPLVKIQGVKLSTDLKKRIGDHIIDAFHREGIPGSSVIVVYSREDLDILLDGGYLVESTVDPQPQTSHPAPEAPAPTQEEISDEFKTRSRRTKAELVELKAQLVRKLQEEGALSSFQAQTSLGLKDCDWAPATLRRFFSELEEEGVITKQGQKRGTRYVWKGITSQALDAAPRLVKKTDAAEDPEE